MMKMRVRRLSLALMAFVAVVSFSGCLSTQYSAMVKYDAASDEFTVLNVYQRISTATPGDAEYLYQLWLNRDHVIRVPNIDIFEKPAILRLTPTTYASINLGEAPKSLEWTPSPIPLDQIRVLPGTFFLRGDDTLCYYDQVVVPGKVIDQAMALFAFTLGPELAKAVDKETQRRKDGGTRLAWEHARKEALESIHPTRPENEPKPSSVLNDPLLILDDESLQLLRTAVADGSLKLKREKQVFRLTIPLSNADAHQVEDLWRAIVELVKSDAAKGEGKNPELSLVISKLLTGLTLSVHPKALELKVDLAIIAEHLPEIYGTLKPLGEMDAKESKRMRDMIAGLRARGATIDEKLTIEDVVKGFVAGSLASHPSAQPVKPGTGLVQAPPAAPPGRVLPPK